MVANATNVESFIHNLRGYSPFRADSKLDVKLCAPFVIIFIIPSFWCSLSRCEPSSKRRKVSFKDSSSNELEIEFAFGFESKSESEADLEWEYKATKVGQFEATLADLSGRFVANLSQITKLNHYALKLIEICLVQG